MFTASQVSLEKFRRWLYLTLALSLVIPSFTSAMLADAAPSIDPQPGFPIRAAFYYAWFPESWKQQGFDPFTNYSPSLGFYGSGSQTLIQQHIAAMQYGGIEAGIASWWGQGSVTDRRMPALLQAAAGTPFRWSIYHERESEGDPSVAQLTSDLTYIRDHYGSDPSFLRIGSRFVVFVYANGADACGMADRWKQANTVGAYIVLKVFPGYRNCVSQPDSWHQYSPAVAADSQAGLSYAIAPGFWKKGDPVTLPRNPFRWNQNICNMVASGAPFQLITTFNEWGEGTSVESAQEWATSSGYGSYLDALHHIGNPATALLPGVVSILRTTPDPLNLLNVNFIVTFSENVTGVNASDFALTTTGVSGAAVSGVSGSGCVYTVTVNTGSGNGTLSLNLVDNDSIKDSGGNPLGGLGVANGNFTGLGTYTITKDVETHVGGNLIGAYALGPSQSKRDSYAQNDGPVKVTSTNAVPIIAAERDAWLSNGAVQSFSEMMGLPADQLTDTYYFPWYNNLTMSTQLRFANLGNTSTDITVTIAGVPQPVIPLAAGESTRVSYPINDGPVKVESSGGVPIIVAERDAWLLNGVVQSFAEMMGLPGNQLSDTYYFPWYNNVTMDTELRFANLGSTDTDITVTIAGAPQPVIPLAVGESTRISYPDLNAGPVKVQSSVGVPIIVTERDAWLINGVVRSFSEMLGLPANQLTDTYYFPWYNNLTMDTQLRFANLGNTSTNITVTIAGVAQSAILLAAGQSTRVSYPVNNGPVKVQSSGGVPIIVAERDAWLLNGAVRSFSEMMGLPGNQLATTYYFPWYNNVTMDTQLRFAVP